MKFLTVWSRCMPSTDNLCHKVIITGTGRAGTTFLVRLLTELGLDTGFTRESWEHDYYKFSSAGLEHDIADPTAPYIVKNPALCTELAPLLSTGLFHLDHVLVPIRELNAVACSRARVGGAHGNVPGGLWNTDNAGHQQSVLAEMFHELVHSLVAHEIPHTFLHFPRFVQDPHYTFKQLAPVLSNVEWLEFMAAFRRIADPTLVHNFENTKPVQFHGTIGREYLAARRHRRRQRRLRRIFVAVTAALIVGIVAFAHKLPGSEIVTHNEVILTTR